MNQIQYPIQNVPQTQPATPNLNSSKCKVFIDNLDQGIAEDYLYKRFKEDCGQISGIKINKERNTQKSKGTAVITFAHPDFAEEARKKFNGQVIIKNVIRVKPYLNIFEQDKQANVYIGNIDESVNIQKLDETFSEFGNVTSIDIKLNDKGVSLGYGYIQFEKKEDVDKLLEKVDRDGIIINNKKVQIERFKSQSERQGASLALFFRAFAKPLNLGNPIFQRIYEHGWNMTLREHFNKAGIHLLSHFVKYDEQNSQPWCMIVFSNQDDALNAYNECNLNRMHECFKTTRDQVIELMKTNEQPKGVDGNYEYSKEDINSFIDFIKTQDDAFKCSQKDFFFNYMKSKHLNVDKRLLLIRNIKQEISEDEVRQFFGKFGSIVRFTLKATNNPKYKTKQAFIHYQTENDSNSALSDVYEKKESADVNKIFYERRQQVTILVPASIRKEMRQLKNSGDAKPNPQNQNKLIPQWQQPNLPFMQIPQQRGAGIPYNPLNNQQPPFPMNQIPMNQINQMQPRQYNINRVQNQNRQQRQQYQGVPRQYPQQFQQQNPRAQQQQIRNPNMNMDQKMNMYPPMNIGPNINLNPNIPMNPNIYQNQLPPQMIPQNIAVPQFRTYSDIVNNMDRFISQTQTIQRNQLGVLLLPKVEGYLRDLNQQVDWAQRVTGMLVDEKQFEISEILSLFDQPEELQSRVEEGVELIREENEEQSGQ